MNKPTTPRGIAGVMPLLAACLLTGCFETQQEFTLNPDGSGKVVHQCRFQEFNLTEQATDPDAALVDAIASILRQSKGVEAWSAASDA